MESRQSLSVAAVNRLKSLHASEVESRQSSFVRSPCHAGSLHASEVESRQSPVTVAPRPSRVSTPRKWNQGKAASHTCRTEVAVSTPRKWNQGKAPHRGSADSFESPRLGSGIKAKRKSGLPSTMRSLHASEVESRQSPASTFVLGAAVSTPRKWNQGKARERLPRLLQQSPRLGSGIKAKQHGLREVLPWKSPRLGSGIKAKR